jgi:hypothetical protein
MIKRFTYIENFFKQKSFSQEDLDFLKQRIDEVAVNHEERRAQQASVSMHLLAFSMGTTLIEPKLNKPIQTKKLKPKKEKERPPKKTVEQWLFEKELEIQNRKPSIVNRQVSAKTEAKREKVRTEMKSIKRERTKEYRGSKNTNVNIIYTRM